MANLLFHFYHNRIIHQKNIFLHSPSFQNTVFAFFYRFALLHWPLENKKWYTPFARHQFLKMKNGKYKSNVTVFKYIYWMFFTAKNICRNRLHFSSRILLFFSALFMLSEVKDVKKFHPFVFVCGKFRHIYYNFINLVYISFLWLFVFFFELLLTSVEDTVIFIIKKESAQ